MKTKEDTSLEELGIDKYEFKDTLIEVGNKLHKIIEEKDIKIENELRRLYSPEQFREFRLLLSALQTEDVYLNKNNNDKLIALCEYAIKMNLCENLNLEKNAKNIYYFIRYNLAQKRVFLSPLFKRDRGPKFLTSLKQFLPAQKNLKF